jgi:dipeptidyl aminopeptidase/acylaminoacyl peptidase
MSITAIRSHVFSAVAAMEYALAATGAVADPRNEVDTALGTSGRIAFVSQQSSVNHINLMQVDSVGVGTSPIRLTNDLEAENYPSWSPDGTRLAYQRDLNGSAIYVINADGTGKQRLSPTPGLDVTPSWSADGTQIVYARLYTAPEPNQPAMTDIRIMNADGSGDHAVLADTLFSVEPRWSVDDRLVFMSYMNSSDLQIYVMNVDGSDLQQLTNAANNGDPVWSPDGTHITFGSDREGGNKLDVFEMNADGSQLTQLTHFDVPYEAGDTNWSGDGSKIAFEYDINGMKQSDPNAFAEVWTMNSDGTGAISTGVPCSDVGCAPRWQPTVATPSQITIGGYMSGNWFNPQQSGSGFQIEAATDSIMLAIWFTYSPDGSSQNWIYAQGIYNKTSSSATLPAILLNGPKFPPNYRSSDLSQTTWGNITFTFTDCNNGTATWSSPLPGYGSGSLAITRLTQIDGTTCPQ